MTSALVARVTNAFLAGADACWPYGSRQAAAVDSPHARAWLCGLWGARNLPLGLA